MDRAIAWKLRTVWRYLQQPVFDPSTRLILNPRTFWQIQFLETCWKQDMSLGQYYKD